jgi:hypothetical protein
MASLILHPDRVNSETPAVRIAQPPRGERDERLAVYTNGYAARVQEALEESFPAVTHVVGHRATHALVARYIPALTRHSYNLNDVGAELPDFLGSDALSRQFPFLPDLAKLEWAVTRAFHAHDRTPLDLGPLATWTEERWHGAVLQFQPSVALVCSQWPVRDLWEARETPIEKIDIDLRERPDRVLVRRAGLGVHCESVSDDEAKVLAALLAGRALREVSQLVSTGGDSVSQWFARWMQQALIIDCTSDECPSP